MLEQHQDSLLPRVTQGEEGHETAEKRPDLVFMGSDAQWNENSR
ncbi:TPA: hypothetical protein J7100_004593 [Escherichia coli]|nr:hypothetical protein [Escherichia coli]HAZ7902050.1 hypothetical protein [Escherichia coli]